MILSVIIMMLCRLLYIKGKVVSVYNNLTEQTGCVFVVVCLLVFLFFVFLLLLFVYKIEDLRRIMKLASYTNCFNVYLKYGVY